MNSEKRQASKSRIANLRRIRVIISGFSAFIILLFILIYLQNRSVGEISSNPTEFEENPIISKVEFEDIQSVYLSGLKRLPFKLVKKENEWVIEGVDSNIPIDGSKVDDLLYSFSNLYAERIIEEKSVNLKQYGLDPPSVIAEATLTNGEIIRVELGDRTPAGNTWYLKKAETDTVYSVWVNHGKHYFFTLDDLRGDALPQVNTDNLISFFLSTTEGRKLEVIETNPVDLGFSAVMTRLAVVSPYSHPYNIDGERWDKIKPLITKLDIDRVVSDEQDAVNRYGLDSPTQELLVRDNLSNSLHLFFGEEQNEEVFFKVANGQTVYAMNKSRLELLDLRPFDLIDRFVLLLNIRFVDGIIINDSTGVTEIEIERTIVNEKEIEKFYINKKEIEDKLFREFYQLLIGLVADAELPVRENDFKSEDSIISISYLLNKPPNLKVELELIPYDRQFLIAKRDGKIDFLVSREQVAKLIEGLNKLSF